MARTWELPRPGATVVDRDDDDRSAAIVVEVHPEASAYGWHIDALDKTVADVNPEYHESAPVVTVAYASDLEAAGIGRRRSVDLLRAAIEREGVRTYDFPSPRLWEVPESCGLCGSSRIDFDRETGLVTCAGCEARDNERPRRRASQ